MAERRQLPTMSVELAIQRELAYRKKVASSLSDADVAEFMKGLLPLEMPSSSKWSAPDRNLRDQIGSGSIPSANHQKSSRSPNPGPERGLVSGPSVVPRVRVSPSASMPRATSSSKPPLVPKSSYLGTKRNLTASSLPCLPPQQHENRFCKVCQVSCSGAFNYKQHLRGHKHKAKQKFLQFSRDGVGESENHQPRCDLCQIWCTDQNSLSLHFKGQKHKAKVQELELGQGNDGSESAKQFWCELCEVPCTNEDTFMLHLQGRNHTARAYAAEMKKKAKFV